MILTRVVCCYFTTRVHYNSCLNIGHQYYILQLFLPFPLPYSRVHGNVTYHIWFYSIVNIWNVHCICIVILNGCIHACTGQTISSNNSFLHVKDWIQFDIDTECCIVLQRKIDEALILIQNADPTQDVDNDAQELLTLEGFYFFVLSNDLPSSTQNIYENGMGGLQHRWCQSILVYILFNAVCFNQTNTLTNTSLFILFHNAWFWSPIFKKREGQVLGELAIVLSVVWSWFQLKPIRLLSMFSCNMHLGLNPQFEGIVGQQWF